MIAMRRVMVYLAGGAAVWIAVAAVLFENATHVPAAARRVPPRPIAEEIARRAHGRVTDARIAAEDGTPLVGWLFSPERSNGAAVVVVHGVSDTRAGTLGPAGFLLAEGYTVLCVDARGHGESGGSQITYGLRERDDVAAWVRWLEKGHSTSRVYGLGVSMGAAILLQSLPVAPELRAVVADSPFSTFREVACHRLGGKWSAPMVDTAFLYGRARYGVDLGDASPFRAVRGSDVPVLLIHGTTDRNIPVTQSRQLRDAGGSTELWEVEGAGHLAAMKTAGGEYRERVLEWFGCR